MIDLTSAGNRSLDTLDSMTDLQMALKAAPMKNDFSEFMRNIKMSANAMKAVDDYMKSPDQYRTLPIRIWHPVVNGEDVKFHVPAYHKPCGTLSNQIFKPSDSRVFRASMEELSLGAVVGTQIKKSGNDFL